MITKKQQELGDQTYRRYRFAVDEHDKMFQDFARYKQLYKTAISDEADYPWEHTLVNPYIFSLVRTALSRMVGSIPSVRLQARNEKSRPNAKVNQSIIDWEFGQPDFFMKIVRMVFSSLMYGKGFVNVSWLYEKEVKIQEEDEEGKDVGVTKMIKPMENRAFITNIKCTNLMVANRNRPTIQEQPWVFETWYPTLGELRNINTSVGYDRYKNLDKLKNSGKGARQESYGFNVQMKEVSGDSEMKVLKIIRMWDNQNERVIEMPASDDHLIIRDEENPYWHGMCPIAEVTCFPEDDDFWSMGFVQPEEDLVIALNSILNHYMDSADQELNPMWLQGSSVQIPEWELYSRPNGFVHVIGDVNQVKRLDKSSSSQVVQPMMTELKSTIQRTVGIGDFESTGTPMPGVRGAAAQANAAQQVDQGLQFLILIMEQTGVRQIGEMFKSLNVQYMTEEQEISLGGNNGATYMKIDPEKVSADFDVVPIPNSSKPRNPLIQQQNLQSFLGMSMKEQGVTIDRAPVYQKLLSVMGETDLDQVVPRDMDEAMEENRLIGAGILVDVEYNDNHAQHVTAHQYFLGSEQDLSKKVVEALIKHIQNHELWEEAKDPNFYKKLMEKSSGVPMPQPTNPIKPENAAPPSLGPSPAQQAAVPAAMPPQGGAAQMPATGELAIQQQLGQQLSRPTTALENPAQMSGPPPQGIPMP